MQELNRGFYAKHEPTDGLLWHRLQIVLTKLKEEMRHNTVHWFLLYIEQCCRRLVQILRLFDIWYFTIGKSDNSSIFMFKVGAKACLLRYPREAIAVGFTMEKQYAGRGSVMARQSSAVNHRVLSFIRNLLVCCVSPISAILKTYVHTFMVKSLVILHNYLVIIHLAILVIFRQVKPSKWQLDLVEVNCIKRI